ncbi:MULTISPECIES: serine hydrolase domain-containing protein [unclassified Capnocytophaga]|uniref:serine hydrolase domain-containing protein n=1 Tax=unclassified Capnocytophaga TaxID=2640652 RepID=UPI0020A648D9|nr:MULTISPECIES: serine hydrolase domain-containing protein [unclassified Capnocytophaga]MEB3004463.1 serine hydrolase domain-containing protein [Capnocytophaga sp. G2]
MKSIFIIMSVFSFFQQLFAQTITQKQIFAEELSKINSLEKGIEQAEMVVKYLLQEHYTPSISICVTKRGFPIWEQGYGYADIENKVPVNTRETLYRIASVSKPLTGVSLTLMQEQGWIDWNCSLYDYVPYFPKKEYDFTVKQLAGHLAGIRAYKGKEVFLDKFMSIKEGIGVFAQDPLLFEPGTKYFYNSYDFNLIALAMQEARKEPFEWYVTHNVLQPLGMNHTFPDMGGLSPNQSVPYSVDKKKQFKKASEVNNFFKLGGGGFLSTAYDVNLLGQAILSKSFLETEYQEQMLTSQHLNNGQETGYGVGWQSTKDWRGRTYYGHIGNGIGGYAWFYVYPEEEIVFTFLFNVTNPSINDYMHRIMDCILKGAEYKEYTTNNYPIIKKVEETEKLSRES